MYRKKRDVESMPGPFVIVVAVLLLAADIGGFYVLSRYGDRAYLNYEYQPVSFSSVAVMLAAVNVVFVSAICASYWRRWTRRRPRP